MVTKKKHNGKEESIHVRLSNPKILRKGVLTLAIELIELLKRFEARMELKSHKENLLKLLQNETNELKKLVKDFNLQELPLTIKQLESLPIVKDDKEEESLRQHEARKIAEVIEKEQKKKYKDERERKEEERRAERAIRQEQTKKPLNKLEADIEALKQKLARI